jgi:quercetin dioxygenase-like cupin family protein
MEDNMNHLNFFEISRAVGLTGVKETGNIEWNAHPVFKGVFLKHILTGADTGGQISSHIVKIDPFCELGNHTHEGRVEIHEVVSGTGSCLINGSEYSYTCGVTAVIPECAPHSVRAGADGLYLMAKFTPALL